MTGSTLAVAAAAAALLLGWLEWTRPDPRRRTARAIAAALSVGALAGLAVRAAAPGGSTRVVLATEGATPEVARRLADSLNARIAVLPDAGDPGSYGAGTTVAPDVSTPLRNGMTVAGIAGWGLDRAELEALDGRPFAFATAPLPAGFAVATWRRTIALGERLAVEGMVIGTRAGDLIRLDDPAGAADSTRVAAGDSTFALVARPPTDGPVRYAIRLLRGGRAIAAETIGVDVRRRVPPRILVLDGAPSFETRYLRDWAARSGGVLSVRTTISRGRFRTLHVNRAPAELGSVRAGTLDGYDVVVLDGLALTALGAAERAALDAAVRERGLGLLIKGDVTAARSAGRGLLAGYSMAVLPGAAERTARAIWDDRLAAPPVRIEPIALDVRDGAPLIRDTTGQVLAAWRPVGAGAVAVSVIASPSRWQLGGDRERFAAYWARVIGSVARVDGGRWEAGAAGPVFENEPIELRHEGGEPLRVAVVDGASPTIDSIYLAQDRLVPTRRTARYWPSTAGWHRVRGGDTTETLRFDVRGRNEWSAWRAAHRARATAARGAGGSAAVGEAGVRTSRPPRVPRELLFATFICATAFLWVSGPRGTR